MFLYVQPQSQSWLMATWAFQKRSYSHTTSQQPIFTFPQLEEGWNHVSSSILLVAKIDAILTSVEVKIVEKATGALLDEDADMLARRALSKAELAVCDGSSLRRGPMNSKSSSRGRNGCGVENEVAHLSEEDVGRAPAEAIRAILWWGVLVDYSTHNTHN